MGQLGGSLDTAVAKIVGGGPPLPLAHHHPNMELGVAVGHVLVDVVGCKPGEAQVLNGQVGIGFSNVRLIQCLGEDCLAPVSSDH